MLPKVVRTWPNLVLLGAMRHGAHVRFANVDLVNALLVSVQVVLSGEARRPITAWYLALEWLLVAKSVFAVSSQSLTIKACVQFRHTCTQTCF